MFGFGLLSADDMQQRLVDSEAALRQHVAIAADLVAQVEEQRQHMQKLEERVRLTCDRAELAELRLQRMQAAAPASTGIACVDAVEN